MAQEKKTDRIGFPSRGHYLQGQFGQPREFGATPSGGWVSRSPADHSDELGKIDYSYGLVDIAVQGAREAFDAWRRTPQAERVAMLRRYQGSLRRRGDELARLIAREVGKPLWEAAQEAEAAVARIDVTLEEGLKKVQGQEAADVLPGVKGGYRFKPLGVVAVVSAFDQPALLPSSQCTAALLTGNTVVLKPSEKAPFVAQLLAECFEGAGASKGVFNLLQGEREVGRRLCVHEGVDVILFSGSYEVGTRIKQDTLQQHWKLLALEMGGKNAAIVCEDADLDTALRETLVAAYLTAGQRSTSLSRILVHESRVQEFVSRFHERAKAFSISHPLENPFMGPLVEQGSVDRYLKFIGIAAREGFEVLMRGKTLDQKFQGNYVTPSICWAEKSSLELTRKSIFQQTEIFGPSVAILSVADLEEAIAQANATQYGLIGSVFTRSRPAFEKCVDDLQVGMVNWNQPTSSISPRLPFGGVKKSGNHSPGGILAVVRCMHPVSLLEAPETGAPADGAYPGLNWA